MKDLKNKLKKQGGFTLVEMLIVVAIIAILIMVSIPMVGSSMEKARAATDAANERSAKMAIVAAYLGQDSGIITDKVAPDTAYYYDAANGKLVAEADKGNVAAYGSTQEKHDNCPCVVAGTGGGADTTDTQPHNGKIIKVSVSSDGTVRMEWTK